ncbi:MAG: hypothetical protein LBP70_01460 [Mycoplasmataceae bacterium]|jgi:hypothetical protein|nr:hypothetical protein [Mycoplasmataceae bacterium]
MALIVKKQHNQETNKYYLVFIDKTFKRTKNGKYLIVRPTLLIPVDFAKKSKNEHEYFHLEETQVGRNIATVVESSATSNKTAPVNKDSNQQIDKPKENSVDNND